MSNLPKVVSEDPNIIVSEMVAQWESATDKTLYPAQVERLMIDLIAYRESLVLASVNDAARQNLVDFAEEPMLSFIGERVATHRLPAQPAKTTLRFSIETPPTSALAISGQPQIESDTGVLFTSQREPVIQPGQTFVDIVALCEDAGVEHNGLLPGSIKEPLDELPEGVSVVNITTTSSGSNEESTERYRQRIKLAQARPSAGSSKQFRYLAMTADINVIDVKVAVIAPGRIRVAVLTSQNTDPTEIIAKVDSLIRQDDNRPTTDNVDVVAAVSVPASATLTLTPRKTALISSLETSANNALFSHSVFLSHKLGYDVVDSEVKALVQNLGGVKRVVMQETSTSIAFDQYAVLNWDISIAEAEDD